MQSLCMGTMQERGSQKANDWNEPQLLKLIGKTSKKEKKERAKLNKDAVKKSKAIRYKMELFTDTKSTIDANYNQYNIIKQSTLSQINNSSNKSSLIIPALLL